MRWTQAVSLDERTVADGEVVWSRRWRQGRGIIPRTTVAKEPGHRGEHEISVCRGKARFSRGCKSLPARVAPAGSNQSSREGNDPAEARPVSKAYQVVDAHTNYRLRKWLCRKHRVQGKGGNRFPDQYLYETLRLVRLPGLTRNLPWAKA
jgi:hypothetical protein